MNENTHKIKAKAVGRKRGKSSIVVEAVGSVIRAGQEFTIEGVGYTEDGRFINNGVDRDGLPGVVVRLKVWRSAGPFTD